MTEYKEVRSQMGTLLVKPFEVRQGKITSVLLINKDTNERISEIPIEGADIFDDLSILTKVDWAKIKEEVSSFKHEHLHYVLNLLNDNDISVLKLLYNNRTTSFSLKGISTTLKAPESTLSDILRRLKYAGIIESTEHKRVNAYSLTSFGIEVYTIADPGVIKPDTDGRKAMEATIHERRA